MKIEKNKCAGETLGKGNVELYREGHGVRFKNGCVGISLKNGQIFIWFDGEMELYKSQMKATMELGTSFDYYKWEYKTK